MPGGTQPDGGARPWRSGAQGVLARAGIRAAARDAARYARER